MCWGFFFFMRVKVFPIDALNTQGSPAVEWATVFFVCLFFCW